MLTIGKLQCQNLLIPDLDLDDLHARGQIWMYIFRLFTYAIHRPPLGIQGFFPNLNKLQNLVFFRILATFVVYCQMQWGLLKSLKFAFFFNCGDNSFLN